jgi:8-oxo-dGTP pyrophosphatase MutT (NUDIX family)
MSYQCNTPITSIGIIAFRNCPTQLYSSDAKPKREYLLIRRKDTLGYIDFIRGKYSVYNKRYILNMFKQMTNEERQQILKYAKEENTQDYGFKLWRQLWTNESLSITSYSQYQRFSSYKTDTKYFKGTEEKISKDKFTILANGRGMGKGRHPFHLQTLVDECRQYPEWSWDEPEWGFPKGRRDTEESDWVCALREFKEETGQPFDAQTPSPNPTPSSSESTTATMPVASSKTMTETSPTQPPPPPGLLQIPTPKYSLRPQIPIVSVEIPISEKKIRPIANLFPFEENFLGSNYKPYKHKYYLMQMDYDESEITFRSTEVSKVAWKTYEECMELFRFYNTEKKQMLTKIHYLLENFTLV